MSYFDDIRFIAGAEAADCTGDLRQHRFDEMCNLQFFLPGRGPMYFAADDCEGTIFREPTAFWHHPDHRFTYYPAEPDGCWHHFWVTFHGERARRIMENGFMQLTPNFYCPVHNARVFAEQFRRLIELVLDRDPNAHGSAVVLLESLLVHLQQSVCEVEIANPFQDQIERLSLEIDRSPNRDVDFHAEAKRMGLSYSHFRRLFTRQLGYAPHDYLLTRRMVRAAALLLRRGGSVKSVALEAGYTDPAQFSKLFKKKIGLSPKQYLDAHPYV